MAILPIVKTPDPILRQPTKTVGQIDKKLVKLIKDMADTLRAQKDPQGVGLAAPQVGYPWRLFVIKPTSKYPVSVFINPTELISELPPTATGVTEGKTAKIRKRSTLLEGCLSLPNYYSDIVRRPSITVKFATFDMAALEKEGRETTVEEITRTFTGFTAQVVQHEMDHLNGRLFVDLVLEQKKKLLKLKGDEWEEVELGKI